jgi:hypothetical protein
MTLSALGIFSAAGADLRGDFEIISSSLLGSSEASVTFSSLGDYSSTYKHLQIRAVVKSSTTGSWNDTLGVRFNGDTGTNYAWHILQGSSSGAAVSAGTSANTISGIIVRGSEGGFNPLVFGPAVIDILDVYAVKNKVIRALSGTNTSRLTEFQVRLSSGMWINTASVTSITLTPTSGSSWIAG